tara:strand:- start:7333 stop:7626 length:294 start_codon:yes stop_codon:yes gene_type:complete
MNKYLKFTVIFLAVLILILFSITVFVIIKKYNQVEDKYIENLEILPKLTTDQILQTFDVDDNKLYLYVKNRSNNKTSIIIYNLKNSKKIGNIIFEEK